MKRGYRIAMVTAFTASAAAAVVGLSALGNASEGPVVRGVRLAGCRHRLRSSTACAIASVDRLDARRCAGWSRTARRPRTAAEARRRAARRVRRRVFRARSTACSASRRDSRAPLPLMQVYRAWGDKPEQQFPVGLLTAIEGLGLDPGRDVGAVARRLRER